MGWPLGADAALKYIAIVGDQSFELEINDDRHITVNGETLEIDFQPVGDQPLYSLIIGGRSYEAHVESAAEGWRVLHRGNLYEVSVMDERAQRLAQAGGSRAASSGEFTLKAPMPGLVVSVAVAAGQTVEKGDLLVVLESMKMQNELKAPRAGTVSHVRVKDGDSVEQNQTLVVVA
ncbi:MAG: biotin/lipoyl-containing protein [Anaerolineales bacterium]